MDYLKSKVKKGGKMGATIHYTLRFNGTEKELLSRLRKVRKAAQELKFLKVGKIRQLDFENNSKNWAEIQLNPSPNFSPIQKKGYVIECLAGKGCEPTNIGLVEISQNTWRGIAFTKTQYSDEFVKCHLKVVHLLDVCKNLGLLEEVIDETGYSTIRRLEVLTKE